MDAPAIVLSLFALAVGLLILMPAPGGGVWAEPGSPGHGEQAPEEKAPPKAPHPEDDPGVPDLRPAIETIQRQCLRAYPPALLSRMTGGAETVPEPVDAEPGRQVGFLSRDVERQKGIFYPTMLGEILPAFQATIEPGTRFLDLGSGDGRVVFLAALLGANATGIEYEEDLVSISEAARESLSGLLRVEKIRFIQGDFFDSSWAGYEVIYYFGLGSFERRRLGEKLHAEMDPGARLIVGHQAVPFEWLELVTAFPDVKVYRRR